MMNISQAARQTGLSAKQIRDYGDNDLQRLHFIRHAHDVGFSLAQTAQLLALQDNPKRRSHDVKALTAQHIAELEQKIQSLQTMLATLQTWHAQCAGDEQAACCILEALAQP